jgi:iron complex outermembrane receptor protein
MSQIFIKLTTHSLLSPKAFVVFVFMLISTFINAQTITVPVKIIVENTKKQPVSYATVKAVNATDSSVVVQKVTDSSGVAVLQLAKGSQYTLHITSVAYTPVEKRIVVTANNTFRITATASSGTLDRVVVTSSRPIMRQEDDKTIVDPENLAASSTNAYEILEKTPGIFVDQDGNVYLSSLTPAKVYINGREQKMSTQDIATMLKSLPPNSILSIEILRTPSAKYDASGGGGIVNIVLKKGVKIGLTGSINTGFNQGTYGNQFVGVNLNNSNGKLSSYINLQYSHRKSYDRIKTDRIFAVDSVLSQNAYTIYPGNSFYTGFGFGYQFNDKWELNYDSRINYNKYENTSSNPSEIRKISNEQLITRNTATVQTPGTNFGISQSISTKYKIDTIGSEWTMDFSYTGAPNHFNQYYNTTFEQPVFTPITGDGDVRTRLNYVSVASNVLLKLPKKLTIETGVKSTMTWFNNNAVYGRVSNGTRVTDAFRTASFKYTENINAAYLQASKNISGFILKVGARLENTNMRGNQLVPFDTSFKLNRTDVFPYVYFSKNLMTIMSYELKGYLVYRRTINRPTYDLLNPFPRFVDQYLFETGNPSLRPQFTQNYEANISVNERPIFAIGVNDTKDIFTNVIYQSENKSVAYKTYDNLGSNKELYFRILGAIPPGKRYFIVAGAQYNQNNYQGFYENKPLSFKKGSWSIFTYQSLKLSSTTQFTLNGFARFNGQLQFYELSSFGALNLSLNQQFLKKKLMVSLSVADVLYTNKNNFIIQQGSVNASGFRESDTRRFGMNIRYNFGFKKKEENNMFNIESPEKTN